MTRNSLRSPSCCYEASPLRLFFLLMYFDVHAVGVRMSRATTETVTFETGNETPSHHRGWAQLIVIQEHAHPKCTCAMWKKGEETDVPTTFLLLWISTGETACFCTAPIQGVCCLGWGLEKLPSWYQSAVTEVCWTKSGLDYIQKAICEWQFKLLYKDLKLLQC